MAKHRDDYYEQRFERFDRRKQGRRIRGARSICDLTMSNAEAEAFAIHDEPPRFKERGLQDLHERGILDELLYQLKSGKEATVFVGRGGNGLVAVKVYADLRVRSFRNDVVYSEGRYIGDVRLQKAIDQHSRAGIDARQALWVEEEYRQLGLLHAAGVPVPTPLGCSGRAIAMEFVGDEHGPAPRLSEAKLSPPVATDAFRQCVENLAHIVGLGKVHGDYSTFNILWWRARAIVIDLPQVIEIASNHNARTLLRRDVESLCTSFSRLGIEARPEDVLRAVINRAGGNGPGNSSPGNF